MEKILISNIGNRNLLFKNESISIKEFKTLTQVYWNEYAKYINDFSLQIIQNHINKDIKQIYLIVTNQHDEKFNYQDTIYEGFIIKKIIEEKYQITVQLIEFNDNPSDENTLFEKLEIELKKVFIAHPNHYFIFNDAGGTTQMKYVCKELLEYYVPHCYQIVYSNKDDEKKVINRIFGSKYTLLKTAYSFVEQYQYHEALKIVEQIPLEAKTPFTIQWWLKYADARKNFNREQVKNDIKLNDFPFKKNQLIQQYAKAELPDNIIPFLELKKDKRADIFEIASLCQLYFSLKEYSLGVLTYYRLVEEIVSAFISTKKISTDKLSVREELAKNTCAQYKSKYPFLEPQWGLPLQIIIGLEESEPTMKKIFETIKQTIANLNGQKEKGLNILRNHCYLVHRMQAITEDKINDHCPGFLETTLPNFFSQLNMPQVNIYDQINVEIKKSFFF